MTAVSRSHLGPWPHRKEYEAGLCPREYKRMPGCECDWCAAQRAIVRANSHSPTLASPKWEPRLTPDELAEAKARLELWRGYGYTVTQIGGLLGAASGSVVSRWLRVPGASISRYYYRKIMATEPWPVAPRTTTRRGGTYVPSLGTVRMLRAMWADGYSPKWLGLQMEGTVTYGRALRAVALADPATRRVSIQMQDDVRALFDKYAGVDPAAAGVPVNSVRMRMREAEARGWAKSVYWDVETIGDPDAFPDYTGMCGTAQGYRIHTKRLNEPACGPCLSAYSKLKLEQSNGRQHAAAHSLIAEAVPFIDAFVADEEARGVDGYGRLTRVWDAMCAAGFMCASRSTVRDYLRALEASREQTPEGEGAAPNANPDSGH